MRRYEKLKDSGVEWIGEIPEHWQLIRLKHISEVKPSNVDKHIHDDEIPVKLCNYTDVYYNEKISDSADFQSGSVTVGELEKFLLKSGDIILTKDSESADDIGVPALVTDDIKNTVCAYHLTLVTPNKKRCIGEFIFRYIQSNGVRMHFEVEANGITRFGLGKSTIENLIIAVPPKYEQTQIVSFLDEKTGKIDALIEAKQRKIELLREKRKALINRAVTKGLNPDTPMKDSGVEWIGEIPERWLKSKLKYFLHYQKGYAFKSSQFTDEGIPVVKASDIKNLALVRSNVFLDKTVASKFKKYSLYTNDIVMSTVGSKYSVRDSAVGQLAMVAEEFNDSLLNQNAVKLFLKNDTESNIHFVFYLLQTKVFRSYLDIHSHGTANQASLNIEDILSFEFYMPTISEQINIVGYLDSKSAKIDSLIEEEAQKIEFLQEYRKSLISEVVTGKIDVRSVCAEASEGKQEVAV